MKSDGESHNSVNRKALRELLVKSFSYEELKDLCFDHYSDLYDNLGSDFGKNVIARLLIAYCERHGLIEHLISVIKKHNPYQYGIYAKAIAEPPPSPSPSTEKSAITLKLIFPDLKIEAFTPDKQAALIELIAEELNIPKESISILEIRRGSVILILRLPASAAGQIMALWQIGHPVIKDLRIGQIETIPLRLWGWTKITRFLTKLISYLKLPFVLTFTLGIVAGLVTGSLTTGLSKEITVAATPTLPASIIFVTPTPAARLLPTAPAITTGSIEEMGLPAASATPPEASATLLPTVAAVMGADPPPTSGLLATDIPNRSHPTAASTPPLPPHTSLPMLTPTPPNRSMQTVTGISAGTPRSGHNLITLEGLGQVEAGQVFTIAVTTKITEPPGVFGAQFVLDYPPDYLEIVKITPHPELLVAVQTFDNKIGQVSFAASRYKDVPNFTEEVTFARLTCRAKPVNQETVTRLALKNVKLGAKGGIMVSTSSQSLVLVLQQ